MNQIVYILKNEFMPGLIKIGRTDDLTKRLKQLYTTSLPHPFEVHYAAIVEDAVRDEMWLHSIFADRRLKNNREFFDVSPELAALALKRVELSEAKPDSGLTPEQEKVVDEVNEKRSRFHFAKYEIPVGSKLTYTRDSNIIAEVVEKDKIKIDDKVNSLSSFAMELLGYARRPQGTLFFKFEDEILDDRRRRMDERKT